MTDERYFYHSFPRPKPNEATIEKGLQILSFMKEVGLILAPEVVKWNADKLSTDSELIEILQRRACFTELAPSELTDHGNTFGPISIEFDIAALRTAGALPVIYAPQSFQNNMVSLLATFIVRGIWHTEKVFGTLQLLEEIADKERVSAKNHLPVPDIYPINLKNNDPSGKIVRDFVVQSDLLKNIIDHIQYRSIPFQHSAALLRLIQNIFYPTDNDIRDLCLAITDKESGG